MFIDSSHGVQQQFSKVRKFLTKIQRLYLVLEKKSRSASHSSRTGRPWVYFKVEILKTSRDTTK